jgi:hypothetical protein
MLPTPMIRCATCHRCVISNTTKEDIDEEMGEAPN